MVKGRTNIPAVDTMGCPCLVLCGLLMYDDTGAWWGKRGLVEVKDSFKLCIGREFGVEPGGVK